MSEVITDKLTGRATAGDVTITSEGGSATMQLQQGVAKAWVNFNGTGTIASRDSFNNSSLTDRGTGKYTSTVSNAMGNANYSAFYTGEKPSTDDGYVMGGIGTGGYTTTTVQVTCQSGSGGPDDLPTVNIANHGDLA